MASQFQTFPVKMCTDEELERLRHHVLRFHSKSQVDPTTFEQPARLHRKDPKNLQFQLSLKEMVEQEKRKKEEEQERVLYRIKYREIQALPIEMTDREVDELMAVEGMNDEEKKAWMENKKRQDHHDLKMEKREKDLMKVAPDGEGKNGSAIAKQNRIKQRRTKQVKVYNEAKRKLRYEEFYPWVLEDYDAKQAWVGNFEASETESYCMLILDERDRCFKMVPIDKFYKFTPRNKYATLTLEEAEAKMADKARVSRWLMSKMEREVEDGTRIDSRYRKKPINTTHDPLFDDDDDNRNEDEDGMDYEDEFQDDEEAPIMEGPDDEKKLVESRMKENMLKANNLIEKSDGENDEFDDLFESKSTDKESKKLKKALSRNAINEVYASDDEDENPYLSEEEEEEEEDEIKKESDSETKVKLEDEEEEDLSRPESTSPKKSKQTKKPESKIYILSVNQGFVTIKATPEILKTFPRGEWNSKTSVKREISPAEEPQPKKVKLEPMDEAVLMSKDIDILLEDGPLDLSQVVHLLKRKVASGNNRALLKKFLKEDFIVRNKKLYRKNQI